MKLSLGEIYGLTRNLQKITCKELPIKTSFSIYRFLKKSSIELEVLENSRVRLIDKYVDKEPLEGEEKVVPKDKVSEFNEEFSSLLKEEIDIDFEPIPLSDFGDVSISADDLIPLQKIFKE